MADMVTLSKADLKELIDEAIGGRMLHATDDAHAAHDAEGNSQAIADLTTSVDTFYLLYAGALVFLMQAGFAMLCAGCLREKNIKNIMLKNVLDACVGAIGFYCCGFGIAYGNKDNTEDWTLIGDEYWFLTGKFEDEQSYHGFFFQFAFAATAATIVSGAVAERCQMIAYALYSAFLTAFVYPVVVHHIWATEGYFVAWPAKSENLLMDVGVIDFAGCGVVHMVGGVSAFLGALVLGPRAGRFDPLTGKIADEMPGHNAALVVLGTFMLWFGWYGFNPGSTLMIAGADAVAAKSAVTTTLAAAAGAILNLIIHKFLSGIISVEETCNGALAGLVAITSACSVVEPWAALLCGAGGSIFYTLGLKILACFKIDDPVCASPVHFFAGMWGLMCPALFANAGDMANAYGVTDEEKVGIFYGGDGKMLVAQAFALGFVVAWVTATMLPFFLILKVTGLFRVSLEVEMAGMDASEHGGAAYHIDKK